MQNSTQDPNPLIGDPERQAPDLHRGIAFQIWSSVEAWVQLKDSEYLFLEGAEDFDVVSGDTALTTQAKSVAANLTLRSDSIVEAITSFWQIQASNPQRVHFRFLTTSSIGEEQNCPFAVAGLKFWQQSSREKDLLGAQLIQEFLRSDTSISAKLKNAAPLASGQQSLIHFLTDATPREVLEKLLTPMKWEVESGDEDVVRKSVESRLRAYGETIGYGPRDSAPAVDRLYRVAAETAKKPNVKDRILTRDRFRLEFADSTSRMVSLTEYRLLQTARRPVTGTYSNIQDARPVTSEFTLERRELVNRLASILTNHQVIVITGSSGMGKSTLATLIAGRLGAEWTWVDTQSLVAMELQRSIATATSHVLDSEIPRHLALDNLDLTSAAVASSETSIAALMRTVRTAGKFVIITTQNSLSPRLKHRLSLHEDAIISVEALSVDEITQFALLLGCPEGIVERLAVLLKIQTSGHPRLVHARLAGLKGAHWPPAELAATPLPEDIRFEREQARQLLNNAATDDKEFLYRLSVCKGPFRRDHAILIGQSQPALNFPSDSFARLSGPWIDTLTEGYFRLSPLLQGAASQNWDAAKVKNARISVATAMLSAEPRTLLEAAEVLFQGMLAEAESPVAAVVIGILGTDPDDMSKVATHLGWLGPIRRDPGNILFKTNLYVSFLLRLLQFRIIAEQTSENLDLFCAVVEAEISGLAKEIRPDSEVLWRVTALVFFEANISPEFLLSYWIGLANTFSTTQQFNEFIERPHSLKFETLLSGRDFKEGLMMMILARRLNTEELAGLFDAIGTLVQPERDSVLTVLRGLLFPLRQTIDRAWAMEPNPLKDQAEKMVEDFAQIENAVREWAFPELIAYLARAKAAILDEFVGDRDSALAVLDGLAGAGTVEHVVKDQKAIVLTHAHRHAEAVELWNEVVPGWPIDETLTDMLPIFACEGAGSAAGNIGDWKGAADFFARGLRLAVKYDLPSYTLGFTADKAFSLWKKGDRITAAQCLRDALTIFATVGGQADTETRDPIKLHGCMKLAEQVIKWCRFDCGMSTEGEVWEPKAGMCSRVEVDKRIVSIQIAPLDWLWLFLAEIELAISGPGPIFEEARLRIPESRYSSFRSVMLKTVIDVSLRKGTLMGLVGLSKSFHEAWTIARTQLDAGANVLEADLQRVAAVGDASATIEESLGAAAIPLVANSLPFDELFAQWSFDLKGVSNPRLHAQVLPSLRSIVNCSIATCSEIQSDPNQYALSRIYAAARVSVSHEVALNTMFVGHARLLDFMRTNNFRHGVERQLAEIVCSQWLRRCEFTAEFLTPRLTVPLIRAACEGVRTGLSTVAQVLIVAKAATAVKVPESLLREWKALIDD